MPMPMPMPIRMLVLVLVLVLVLGMFVRLHAVHLTLLALVSTLAQSSNAAVRKNMGIRNEWRPPAEKQAIFLETFYRPSSLNDG